MTTTTIGPFTVKINAHGSVSVDHADRRNQTIYDLALAAATEIERLRAAMLSALSATDAAVGPECSTDFLCLGAEEIRLCLRRIKSELNASIAAQNEMRERLRVADGLLTQAFNAFKITQRPSDYPEEHWARRVPAHLAASQPHAGDGVGT